MTSAADAFNAANSAFADEDYDEALEQFNLAIDLGMETADVHVKRAATYIKLGKFPEALQDANCAIGIDNKCANAYMRKGAACFELEEFETAKAAFCQGLEISGAGTSAHKKFSSWVAKCEEKIDDDDDDDDDEDDDDDDDDDIVAASQVGNGGAATQGESTTVASTSAASAPIAPAAAAAAAIANGPRVRHDFYQTASHVVVTVLQKKLTDDDVSITIGEDSLVVLVTLSGEEVRVIDAPLFASVVVDDSTHRVTPSKVEIKLKKANPGVQWSSLVKSAGAAAIAPAAAGGGGVVDASAPARPYAGTKDWDAIDRDLAVQEEQEKPEGEEALQKLFRQIYGKANEDTRRAMNKSFQTSGGTVLSTNWGEVGEKDYEKERTAPDGMKWEKVDY